jgi:hypothetical protein
VVPIDLPFNRFEDFLPGGFFTVIDSVLNGAKGIVPDSFEKRKDEPRRHLILSLAREKFLRLVEEAQEVFGVLF